MYMIPPWPIHKAHGQSHFLNPVYSCIVISVASSAGSRQFSFLHIVYILPISDENVKDSNHAM